ncbi:calcium/sodium antiporter [Evansella cellulosilytica]|uniref:Na+/Ca+ antiporter, CaCA family n=1 Tax=Evansella cellulosilytica (strain ATCC 21833 / DSM 2522 / FERM P-1141 / JCM 9156 / N-4) TaxID=649639 RepID=E6U1C0_EVAC2|nr:calcium/sodium antiporter [Evansella cellulosilytica]ADU29167.1 Na+/Ca+ antiporter, CaCA family [Evansella cellulosilytica DSM 2522]
MTYFLLLLGFVLLIKGADYFVEGSSKIASLLRVPPMIVGLTIVAFGTGSPEATVSIIAALEGNAGVTVGNIVGSNILNTALVVGLTAFIFPLKVQSETIRKEIPFTFLASVVLLVLISDTFLQQTNVNVITRSDGIIFLLFFCIFLYYIFEVARNSRDKTVEVTVETSRKDWGKNIIITIAGLAAIIIGGYLVVESSTSIAITFGMSETLVGLTIVAIGSSLPELITSMAAALKKQSEIAIGNIVGSNVFNILFVLGISSIITPLPIDQKIFADIWFMIVLTIVLLIFAITQCKVSKREGSVLTLVYIAYFVFIIIRG